MNSLKSKKPKQKKFQLAQILNLYREAIVNLPFLKYSWVIVATVCILSLVTYFKLENSDVFIYTFGVIFLSFLAFLFSSFLKSRDSYVRFLVKVLLGCIATSTAIFILGMGSYIICEKPDFFARLFNSEKVEHPKENSKPVEKAPMPLSDKMKIKADSLNLIDGLTEIFYCMTNVLDYDMEKLSADSLKVSDTALLAQMVKRGKRMQTLLEGLQENFFVLNSDENITVLKKYYSDLGSFNQSYFYLRYKNGISFPFLEKGPADRKDFFIKYKQSSRAFFEKFSQYAKDFPLDNYLNEHLAKT